jgi:hypothetical protein
MRPHKSTITNTGCHQTQHESGDNKIGGIPYDAGQGSEANQAAIEASPLHFVSSVPPAQHPHLTAIDRRRYRKVAEFAGVTAFDSHAEILGSTRRVVVTHSTRFHAAQSAGFDQTLTKAGGRLNDIAGCA